MNFAIYARVSTKQQSPAMQLDALRVYAAQRGITIHREYVDVGHSGSKESRPALDAMMSDAKKRLFAGVLVWKFDRFARSVKHLVTSLVEFQHLGISFISYSENLDTSSPMGRAMFAVIAAMAQLERDLICERVTAGVRRARAHTTRSWGRQPLVLNQPIPEGLSLRQAAKLLGVSRATIQRRRKDLNGSGR
jgi:DNA invertase Pin-like site-specific DNA recombinase